MQHEMIDFQANNSSTSKSSTSRSSTRAGRYGPDTAFRLWEGISVGLIVNAALWEIIDSVVIAVTIPSKHYSYNSRGTSS